MEVLPEKQPGRKLSDEGNGSGDLDSITALLLSHKYKSNPIREPYAGSNECRDLPPDARGWNWSLLRPAKAEEL